MNFRAGILSFFILALSPILCLAEVALSEADYEQIKIVSLDILSRFPPSEYEYVALGRSPTPFVTFIQQTGIKVSSIPISSLRNFPFVRVERKEEKLLEHFAKYLPPHEMVAGKKILVIDYTDSGDALRIGRDFVEKHYSKISIPVKGYVLNQGSSIFNKVKKNEIFFEGKIGLNSSLDQKLFKNYYDRAAPYGRFDLFSEDQSKRDLAPGESFKELNTQIERFWAVDPANPKGYPRRCDILFGSLIFQI